jgi:hypothetical protein
LAPDTADVAPDAIGLVPDTADGDMGRGGIGDYSADMVPDTADVVPDTIGVAPDTVFLKKIK